MIQKISISFFFSLVMMISITIISYGETSDDDTLCPNSTIKISLNHYLETGQVIQSCFNKNEKSLLFVTQSNSNSTLNLEIPRIFLDKVDLNCEDIGFSVYVNSREVNAKDSPERKYRNLEIPVNDGESKIIIIAAESIVEKIDLGNFLDCNIEIISEFSPLKQQKYMIDERYYSCKQGLEFILKNDNSPACVKPNSIQKLLERGWAKS